MTLEHKNPVLRVVPGPSDINANGHIFGGWVLSQMDIAAGIVASHRANGPYWSSATGKTNRSRTSRRCWNVLQGR